VAEDCLKCVVGPERVEIGAEVPRAGVLMDGVLKERARGLVKLVREKQERDVIRAELQIAGNSTLAPTQTGTHTRRSGSRRKV